MHWRINVDEDKHCLLQQLDVRPLLRYQISAFHVPHPFQLLEYQWQEGGFDTLGKLVSAHPGGGQHPAAGCCPRGGWVGRAGLAHLTHLPGGIQARLVGGWGAQAFCFQSL